MDAEMAAPTPADILNHFYPQSGWTGAIKPAETSGFSGAAVFRVESEIGSLCLRRWPPEPMTARRLAGIHRLLGEVYRSGLAMIPVPLLTRSGETVVDTRGELWQLEPWMPGKADFHDNTSDKRLDEIMTTLARFHIAAREASSDSRSDDCPPTLPERLQILRSTQQEMPRIEQSLRTEPISRFRKVASRIALQIREHSSRIEFILRHASRQTVPVLPCLRDIWHDHLLFEGDELTGLVDFGAMRVDTVAADLSRLLSSLFPLNSMQWSSALSLYEKERPLTDAERNLIPVLAESGTLLSGTQWLRARYVHHAEFDMSRVCDRLESISDRLESA
jgi:Ser/Thr protein kinase RdoA (MazF antagonist)